MTKFAFATANGAAAQGYDAIFAIMKVVDGRWHPIGTGFFIMTHGVFLTAWHVFHDALAEKGAMNCNGIAAFHMLPDTTILLGQLLRSCHHTRSDIAVGVLAEALHDSTGAPLANKVMRLTTHPQQEDSEIVTWAYPRTSAGIEEGVHKIRFSPNFYNGFIEEHFPIQRDNHLMPFPCYRGSIEVLGGASGGPVVNLDNGRVFGLNCPGVNGSGYANLSHYSSLSVVGELWVDDISIDGQHHDRLMISELVTRGLVDCN